MDRLQILPYPRFFGQQAAEVLADLGWGWLAEEVQDFFHLGVELGVELVQLTADLVQQEGWLRGLGVLVGPPGSSVAALVVFVVGGAVVVVEVAGGAVIAMACSSWVRSSPSLQR